LVLFLAANTAYNGFPLLGSILAQDRYLPRQLHTRTPPSAVLGPGNAVRRRPAASSRAGRFPRPRPRPPAHTSLRGPGTRKRRTAAVIVG
ncbi:hypothetical protein, partial [Streptomyces sp. PU_AKi4]|uniref:hypothetical protein n=1 Tax=Streptomyces sp. PU_AKi4 TaxID=2800809 RepID=UPI00352623B8